MLNELEQKIRKAIPELNELGVGCVFIRNTEKWRVIGEFTENNGSGRNRFIIETLDKENYTTSGFINTSFFAKQIEIIGKPIQLNHVLEYLSLIYTNGQVDIEVSNSILYIMKGNIMQKWNLKSNLLSEQSEELIKFINEL